MADHRHTWKIRQIPPKTKPDKVINKGKENESIIYGEIIHPARVERYCSRCNKPDTDFDHKVGGK